MDRNRLEAVTAPPKGDSSAPLSEEEMRLREAWLSFAGAMDATTGALSAPDPDDLFAEILRRDRRRRFTWRRNAVLGASMLAAALLVGAALRNVVVGLPAHTVTVAASDLKNAPAWEDDWDAKAQGLDTDLVAVDETLQVVDDPWIDRQIQRLFQECAFVWAML